MNRRARIWLVVAVLFTIINVLGGVVAALRAELVHTGIHVALALLGEYFVWRLWPKRVPSY